MNVVMNTFIPKLLIKDIKNPITLDEECKRGACNFIISTLIRAAIIQSAKK